MKDSLALGASKGKECNTMIHFPDKAFSVTSEGADIAADFVHNCWFVGAKWTEFVL